MQIEYQKLKRIITQGLLEHHGQELKGMYLINQGMTSLRESDEEIDKSVELFLSPMPHNVIVNLKKTFNGELIITEDGEEVLTELK